MNSCLDMTRRQWLGNSALAAAGLALSHPGRPAFAAPPAPVAPVAIAKCPTYEHGLTAKLDMLFDQIGGITRLVRGKTVTVKLNLTAKPDDRFSGRLPGVTHWVHPVVVGACCHAFGKAGAKRIRLVESTCLPNKSLEQFMSMGGWDVKALAVTAKGIEFERTANLGKGKRYSRLKVPYGGFIYPAYDLNHSYEDTDVFVTITKLKNHGSTGVTLAMKNNFGIPPNSIYSDDAGTDEPNESAQEYRALILHQGRRQPPKSAPQELKLKSPPGEGSRMPRIVVDLVAARPIDLAIIDGIESMAGGVGPWVKNAAYVNPGVLIAGRNPVCTDAVATAVMGFDPRADRGTTPFYKCDNLMKIAESVGIGSADLSKIDVRGVSIREVQFDFGSHWKS